MGLIGIRVFKTAAAVFLSTLFASLLGLNAPENAGLLSIMGIHVTKRLGVKSVAARILASLASLLLGALLFLLFGFHIWVISVYVLIAFPILGKMKLAEGIVTGAVIFFHLYHAGEITSGVIGTELALLFIGLGTSTLINIAYMPSFDKQLQDVKRSIEWQFSAIFGQFAAHLRDLDAVWDGRELLDAGRAAEAGAALATKKRENALFSESNGDWPMYFFMRSQQVEMLGRMAGLLAYIYQTVPQGHHLAGIFEELQEDVKEDFYVGRVERKVLEIERHYRNQPLPATREEFEVRSALLQLIRELKIYLELSKKTKKQKDSSRSF